MTYIYHTGTLYTTDRTLYTTDRTYTYHTGTRYTTDRTYTYHTGTLYTTDRTYTYHTGTHYTTDRTLYTTDRTYTYHTVYAIRQKERNTNLKFVHLFLIRNVPHFYGLPLDLCRKCIAVLFANVPQFGETRHISWENCRNLWIFFGTDKNLQIFW